jgi:hypothetical protein
MVCQQRRPKKVTGFKVAGYMAPFRNSRLKWLQVPSCRLPGPHIRNSLLFVSGSEFQVSDFARRSLGEGGVPRRCTALREAVFAFSFKPLAFSCIYRCFPFLKVSGIEGHQ